jgi:hypothetical protein
MTARVGGGKNDIPNRLKRQFAMFAVPLPSAGAINNIFGGMMKGRFGSGMHRPSTHIAPCRASTLS